MSQLTVSLRGDKEVAKLLDSLSGRELKNRTRRATRAGAKIMRAEVRSEAKSRADLPDSFAKTATRNHQNPLATSTGPTSPLINVFEVGAKPHPEKPGTRTPGATVLSNFNDRRQAAGAYHGGIFIARSVHHPGMGARPLIAPVFARTHDKAADEAMDELVRGLR